MVNVYRINRQIFFQFFFHQCRGKKTNFIIIGLTAILSSLSSPVVFPDKMLKY